MTTPNQILHIGIIIVAFATISNMIAVHCNPISGTEINGNRCEGTDMISMEHLLTTMAMNNEINFTMPEMSELVSTFSKCYSNETNKLNVVCFSNSLRLIAMSIDNVGRKNVIHHVNASQSALTNAELALTDLYENYTTIDSTLEETKNTTVSPLQLNHTVDHTELNLEDTILEISTTLQNITVPTLESTTSDPIDEKYVTDILSYVSGNSKMLLETTDPKFKVTTLDGLLPISDSEETSKHAITKVTQHAFSSKSNSIAESVHFEPTLPSFSTTSSQNLVEIVNHSNTDEYLTPAEMKDEITSKKMEGFGTSEEILPTTINDLKQIEYSTIESIVDDENISKIISEPYTQFIEFTKPTTVISNINNSDLSSVTRSTTYFSRNPNSITESDDMAQNNTSDPKKGKSFPLLDWLYEKEKLPNISESSYNNKHLQTAVPIYSKITNRDTFVTHPGSIKNLNTLVENNSETDISTKITTPSSTTDSINNILNTAADYDFEIITSSSSPKMLTTSVPEQTNTLPETITHIPQITPLTKRSELFDSLKFTTETNYKTVMSTNVPKILKVDVSPSSNLEEIPVTHSSTLDNERILDAYASSTISEKIQNVTQNNFQKSLNSSLNQVFGTTAPDTPVTTETNMNTTELIVTPGTQFSGKLESLLNITEDSLPTNTSSAPINIDISEAAPVIVQNYETTTFQNTMSDNRTFNLRTTIPTPTILLPQINDNELRILVPNNNNDLDQVKNVTISEDSEDCTETDTTEDGKILPSEIPSTLWNDSYVDHSSVSISSPVHGHYTFISSHDQNVPLVIDHHVPLVTNHNVPLVTNHNVPPVTSPIVPLISQYVDHRIPQVAIGNTNNIPSFINMPIEPSHLYPGGFHNRYVFITPHNVPTVPHGHNVPMIYYPNTFMLFRNSYQNSTKPPSSDLSSKLQGRTPQKNSIDDYEISELVRLIYILYKNGTFY